MEYSKYSGLLIYEYLEHYSWLCQCILSLCEQIESFEEMGFYGYSEKTINGLKTSMRSNQDQAHELSEWLKRVPYHNAFEEFKHRLRHMRKDRRPAFPDTEVIESICALLRSVWNRFNQLSDALNRWHEIGIEAFTVSAF